MLKAGHTHFGAHYLLGIIALQRGQFQIAEQRIAGALALNPNAASAHRDRAVALARLDRNAEALASLDRAILLKPDDADAHGHRGNVLQELGRFADALECYDRAIALSPLSPILHHNRGIARHSLGQYEEALAAQDRAIALKPDYAAAFNKRGTVLWALERHDEALASYDAAIARTSDFVDAHYNRGLALQHLGRFGEAVESYDRALAFAPDFAEALSNRGNALQKLGHLEAALESYDRALAIKPDFAEAHYNRGVMLLALKRPEEALASYDRALARAPDHPEILFSRGVCKLALGRMERSAWDDYENRWRMRNYPARGSGVDAPHWTGEDLAGCSILVYAEQGLGDIIQFSRLVPLLGSRGADVSFLVPAKLHRLLSGLPGDMRLLAALPDRGFDFQCDLQSLPRGLGLEFGDIPLDIPYLAVEPSRVDHWRKTIGPHGFRAGIAWQGARWHNGVEIVGRGVPLREFYPLSQIPGLRLIGIQKNEGAEQLADLPAGMQVETLGADFDAGPDAFADTAAAMQHFDVIITCDTSIAHLAGALGRPTWIALKYVPEWRWMLNGSDSPWYPSARLFRQKIDKDWSAPIAGMVERLRQSLAARPSGRQE
ncbi:MAG TPA: tetratricopeptide repeat-containing glycosyltransferase family protein [Micropepsaceae bacterium]